MKFQVRDGFVIHDLRVVDINGRPTEQTNSYYGDQIVDFDEATATDHLHKLEPQDKASREFMAARFVPVAPPPVAGIDPTTLAALIAQAVAAAMVTMQAAPAVPPAA